MMKKQRVIQWILILCVVGGISYIILNVLYEQQTEKKIKEELSNYTVEKNQVNMVPENIMQSSETALLKNLVPQEYMGYTVCAMLRIPAIELETYVLKNYSKQALTVSVVKYWGANPNEIGNFCVAGHNFIYDHMFKNLKKLKVGDTIYIIDNQHGEVAYEVYDIFQVTPKEVDCLYQATEGKRETTLITCTNDSQQRVIVKARESLQREEKKNEV